MAAARLVSVIPGCRAAGRSGLTPEQRLEKGEIMKRILQIDAQIRNLAEPSAARYAHRYRHSVARAATP